MEARREGRGLLVGTPGFLEEQGVDLAPARDEFTRLEAHGLTAIGGS